MYDLIIIGAGPAGITAAIYAARKKISFLIISKDIGGQAVWSSDIQNYTGYQFITGPELAGKFEEHIKQYNVTLNEQEEVLNITRENKFFTVKTNKNSYQAKTILIASGKKSKELNIPGEKEFKNKGVAYCATCDGPLFANKTVVIVGGGNSALDAGLQLMLIAKQVYIINITSDLTGDAIMKEKIQLASNVVIKNNSQIREIYGEKFVKGIKFVDSGVEKDLAVDGVFIEAGLIPTDNFIDFVEKNELGEIKVNCNNETSCKGVFAAGDVTNVMEKQIIIAAGEGAKATLSVFRYLSLNKF